MALEASDNDRRELEYATQYFDFTPDSFIDTISFSSTDIIDEELNKLRSRLMEKFPGKITQRELDDCFTIVKDQYTESAEKVLTTFGKYLNKNILCIPKNVLLPEDKVHSSRNFTGDDLENSLKNVDNLCLKIRNAKYKKAILQAKLANLQKVSLRQEKLLQEVNILTEQKHQMEALFDQQTHILEEKLKTLGPIIQKLENNVDLNMENVDSNVENDCSDKQSKKRNLDYEQSSLSKMFRVQDDEEDD